jgi:hypothetical protein
MSLFFSFVAATSFSPLVVASSFSFFMNRLEVKWRCR